MSGVGTSRSITLTPQTGQSGSSTITITVEDGSGSDRCVSFFVTVTSVNDPPSISSIADQTINEDSSMSPVGFTVSDSENPAGSLTVTASSSNTTLIANGNITLGGAGATRNIELSPQSNATGTAIVTVVVEDSEGLTAIEMFEVEVVAVNDAPTISAIDNQSTPEDTPLGPVSFSIGDVESSSSALDVSATSSMRA